MSQDNVSPLFRAVPIDQFETFLEKAGATLPCPRCGNVKFLKMNEAATNQHAALVLEALGDADRDDRTDRFPVIPATCTRCGWIAFHLKAMVVSSVTPAAAGPSPGSPAPVTMAPELLHGLRLEVSDLRAALARLEERSFHAATRADLGGIEGNIKGRIDGIGNDMETERARLGERLAQMETVLRRRTGFAHLLGRCVVFALVAGAGIFAYLRWGDAMRSFVGV